MASTLSTIAVDFIANVAKYLSGLDQADGRTKTWAGNTEKENKKVAASFAATSKALDQFILKTIGLQTITKIAGAFGNVAKEAADLADEAAKVGASVDAFAALDVAAKRNGTNIEAVKMGYKELRKSIYEAIAGNKDVIKSFDDLGLSYSYLNTLSPDERFLQTADALSKIQDETERARIGTGLLAKAYTELNPLVALGGEGIKNASAGSSTGAEVEKLDKLYKKYEEITLLLQNKLKAALISNLPFIEKLTDGIALIIRNLEGIIKVSLLAFSPVVISTWTASLLQASNALAFYGKSQAAALAATTATNGALTLTALTAPILSGGLLALRTVINGVALSLGVLVAALQTIAVAVGAVLVALYALVKTYQLITYLLGSILKLISNTNVAANSLLRTSAYAGGMAEGFLEGIGKEFGFGADEVAKALNAINAANATVDEAANNAGKALDKEGQAALKAAEDEKKAAEDLIKTYEKRAEKVKEVTLSTIEEYRNEAAKIQEIFDLEYITQEEYTRGIEKLRKDASKNITDLITEPSVAIKKQILEIAALSAEGIISVEEAQRGISAVLAKAGDATRKFITTPLQEAKAKILEFENQYVEGFISIEERTMAVNKLIKETGQSIIDSFADPSQKAQVEIKKIFDAFDEGFITEEEALKATKKITDELSQSQADLAAGRAGLTGDKALIGLTNYNKALADIEIALPADKLELTTQRTEALRQAQIKFFEDTSPYWSDIVQFSTSFADGLANAIVAGENFGEALRNVFQDVLKQIAVLIIRTTILQAIMASIGLVNPVAAGAFGNMVGLTGPNKRADGGPVTGGSPYLVGENGPELMVPGSSGVVIPNGMLGGGGVVVNQVINVQTGVASTVRAEMLSLLPSFKQQAIAGVLESKLRGGSFAKGLAAA